MGNMEYEIRNKKGYATTFSVPYFIFLIPLF